jgi:CBS domain-containing protein
MSKVPCGTRNRTASVVGFLSFEEVFVKVSDLCVREVSTCSPETSLARAGAIMRKENVGCLPVLDRQERVVGIVTDRDIALELTRRNEPGADMSVDEVMGERPSTCTAEDDVRDVLETMARDEVRRLPVVDDRGRLEGIVSIDDVLCHAATEGDSRQLPHSEVIETFCRIAEGYQPASHPEPRSRRSRGSSRRESSRQESEGNGGKRRERMARH